MHKPERVCPWVVSWECCLCVTLQVAWHQGMGPLQRLHHQLQQSLQLAHVLHGKLAQPSGVAAQAIQLEMLVWCQRGQRACTRVLGAAVRRRRARAMSHAHALRAPPPTSHAPLWPTGDVHPRQNGVSGRGLQPLGAAGAAPHARGAAGGHCCAR
jgi:hypothetical protein